MSSRKTDRDDKRAIALRDNLKRRKVKAKIEKSKQKQLRDTKDKKKDA